MKDTRKLPVAAITFGPSARPSLPSAGIRLPRNERRVTLRKGSRIRGQSENSNRSPWLQAGDSA